MLMLLEKSLKLDKTMEVGNDCLGITTSGDGIVVCREGEIRIISQDDTYVRVFAIPEL